MHYTYNQRNVTYSIVVSFCYSCWNFSDKKQPIHHTVVCSRLERTTTTIAVKAAEIVPALLVKATGRTRWRSTRINGFTLPALHAPLSVISCGKQVAKKWTKSRQAKWEEKTPTSIYINSILKYVQLDHVSYKYFAELHVFQRMGMDVPFFQV